MSPSGCTTWIGLTKKESDFLSLKLSDLGLGWVDGDREKAFSRFVDSA